MSGLGVVSQFRGLHALVIGDAMLDSYVEGSAARLCSEGPVPVVRKTAEQWFPGGAANTAVNLCALRASVTFLGVTGRDAAGERLCDALRRAGVDDRLLVRDDAISTLHKMRILADDQYVVRLDEGDADQAPPAIVEHLLTRLDETYPHCDLVVVSDYGYGTASPGLIDRLRVLRTTRPCVLAIDSKDLRRFRHAGATIITPNHLEARLAVGITGRYDGHPDLGEMRSIGRRLLTMTDTEYVAITMAGDGVLLLDRAGWTEHLPAYPVRNANDVGAGDSFTAATALALAAGAHVSEAARIGIEAASIALTKRWTATVEHGELLQRLSLRHHTMDAGDGATEDMRRMHLAAILDEERLAGNTIVFTNGVFDILHAGHIDFLRRAKELGDVLVVGVNSDGSARRLKGPQRPINGQAERLALVAALDPVDHVVLFDEDDPAELIRVLRPDIHVKGGDYAGANLPEAGAVRAVGGRVVILPLAGSLSTSTVIDRIVASAVAGAGT